MYFNRTVEGRQKEFSFNAVFYMHHDSRGEEAIDEHAQKGKMRYFAAPKKNIFD